MSSCNSTSITCYQGLKLQLIQVPMSVTICKMTHISVGNPVAGERYLGFPRRYVGPGSLCLLLITCYNHLGSKLVILEHLNSKITS